ncbi:MAG: hypothetical protein M0Q51_12885 [Bacteroidales bacterium]|nr:hypothetical protein [Bacteroidales bacterium]
MSISSLEKIVTIIGSLGTFGAALIAWRTLAEIKKQRFAAQKPQILFKSFTSGSLDLNDFQKIISTNWKGNNDNFKNHILFEMINAGKDLAKDFKFEYKLNIDSFIALIEQHDKEKEISIQQDNNWLIFSSSTNRINKRISLKVNAGETDNLEYLLNRAIQEKPSGFSIPEEYLVLNSCLLYLSLKYEFTIYTDDVPKIYVKTTFEDISGKKDYIYQTIDTFYFRNGEFHFSLKKITEKRFYAA